METNSNFYRSVGYVAIATGILLLIPLIGMQFSDDVVWTLSDFVIAGILLFGTGFAYIWVTRVLATVGDSTFYRAAVGLALFSGLFLIWSNLAVGIIGSENNSINTLYFGVIFIGITGAVIARFQPHGMAYVMFTMALTQALIAGIALFTGMAEVPESSVTEILTVNGFFITLFTVSALLFRYAEQERTPKNAVDEG